MPRGIVQEVEAAEEKPIAGVVMGLNGLGYLLVACALAAGIAWIVFVGKANANNQLGNDEQNASGDSSYTTTIDVCFQATVVSVLLYFVARHHFSNLHY